MMIVLDGHALNPGDLTWEPLAALGHLTVYSSTPISEVPLRAKDAFAVFTNKTVLHRDTLRQMPNLKYIGILATGVNVVDVSAARELGITVTNVPGYSTDSVAQLAMAHLLNLSFHLSEHVHSVKDGLWTRCSDFCYRLAPMMELIGKTFGVIGFGDIGRAAARIAQAFGMKILVYTPSRCKSNGTLEKPCFREMFGFRDEEILFVDLDTLLQHSDAVSIHCPLTGSNRKFLGREQFSRMKPTAFLINTARGPLIDEDALADALHSGQIAGAGLDVLSMEPPSPENPLLTAKNCYITPHAAWGTMEARLRLVSLVAENFRAFLNGHPINDVIE
jgi:glycerate dehydrogenase